MQVAIVRDNHGGERPGPVSAYSDACRTLARDLPRLPPTTVWAVLAFRWHLPSWLLLWLPLFTSYSTTTAHIEENEKTGYVFRSFDSRMYMCSCVRVYVYVRVHNPPARVTLQQHCTLLDLFVLSIRAFSIYTYTERSPLVLSRSFSSFQRDPAHPSPLLADSPSFISSLHAMCVFFCRLFSSLHHTHITASTYLYKTHTYTNAHPYAVLYLYPSVKEWQWNSLWILHYLSHWLGNILRMAIQKCGTHFCKFALQFFSSWNGCFFI